MQAKRTSSKLLQSASLFAALGDATRLRLVERLCHDGPASITRLSASSNISRQAITKHLHVLAGAGVVQGIRAGRQRLYSCDPQKLRQARQYLDLISTQWDDVLSRLKLSVEAPG